MKTLPPQILSDKDVAPVKEGIKEFLYQKLFKRLLDTVSEVNAYFEKQTRELRNTSEDGDKEAASTFYLERALKAGTVQYKAGVFTGQFNRAISAGLRSIGAKFSTHTGHYHLVDADLPPNVRAAAFLYETVAKTAHESILRSLDDVQKTLRDDITAAHFFTDDTAEKVAEGFKKAAEGLEVQPHLSDESMETLREEYLENLRLFVKNFADREIFALRSAVQDNARAGYRFSRLASIIKERYQVTESKANFLARQETSLFMSEFRRLNFSEAGVTRYIWRTARDRRVRDAHAHLEGRVFFYSDPPIVDPASGRRRNPGQDYGCRCFDQPLLDTVSPGDED